MLLSFAIVLIIVSSLTCNNRQFAALCKAPEALFPGINQWADDLQVPLLVLVCSLHRPQPAVVEDRHEEALRQVVQVLTQREHIVALATSSSIDPTALHSRAKSTDGRTVALQGLGIE